MKSRHSDSPVKLALLAVLGSLIASMLFIGSWIGPHSGHPLGQRILIAVILFASGFTLLLRSVSNLKNGFENQRWPASQMEPLRKHIESPFYLVFFALLGAFALIGLIVPRFQGDSWVCFLFLMTFSQLRLAVRSPMSSKPSGLLIGWRDYLAPIRSDRWGQR